ncbi:helix-turn-helix domain-containing protein [Bremerella alba]|uniref:Helix-turn-helix domain-containing protein n=1 Tax=Bremerella alba TaxID=980252 RepID=A0A7V8V9B2_9BACT|nr:hypothetical protein [Bremerella alba]
MLTLKDVAERLHVSRDTVRRIVLNGELPAYRIGGQYRITQKDIDSYLGHNRIDEKEEAENAIGTN